MLLNRVNQLHWFTVVFMSAATVFVFSFRSPPHRGRISLILGIWFCVINNKAASSLFLALKSVDWTLQERTQSAINNCYERPSRETRVTRAPTLLAASPGRSWPTPVNFFRVRSMNFRAKERLLAVWSQSQVWSVNFTAEGVAMMSNHPLTKPAQGPPRMFGFLTYHLLLVLVRDCQKFSVLPIIRLDC